MADDRCNPVLLSFPERQEGNVASRGMLDLHGSKETRIENVPNSFRRFFEERPAEALVSHRASTKVDLSARVISGEGNPVRSEIFDDDV